MSRDRQKWRWWLIDKLNHLPGFCWADLVSWVITGPEPRDEDTCWPHRRDGYTLRSSYCAAKCRADANAHPNPVHQSCYCGKVGRNSPGELGDDYDAVMERLMTPPVSSVLPVGGLEKGNQR